ncbi:endolytic transglycosylase MltG [Brevibacterium rongguiense]|uniref:endolytic transglycosylase MltG n=1 Tax=Brevibacterium rongguiense TaxID=2695267 RepID=UPI002E287C41|nr:endolytic transglycosylase MltG [Brevibacterium rongguiense]
MNLHEELTSDDGLTRAERRAQQRRIVVRRRRTVAIVALAVVVLLVACGAAFAGARGAFGDLFAGGGDYEGGGEGEVVVEVLPSMSAKQIANKLVDEDVIKSADPFLKIVKDEDLVLQAGNFAMKKHMSAQAAIDTLKGASAANRVQIPEGSTLVKIKQAMVKAGLKEAEVDAAIDKKKPRDYGLKVSAPSLEGYLFPATYDVDPKTTPKDLVQSMVNKTRDELNSLAIDNDDANRYLTLASIIQVEASGDEETRAKVARVLLNRLGSKSQTNGMLQLDSTVAYIHGAREDLTTTAEQRKSKSPYNTYKVKGLPPGPINSPGEDTVRAAQHPATGDWQYFVATNPDTGETKFAANYKDHQKNVEEYRAWLREHRSAATKSADANSGQDG